MHMARDAHFARVLLLVVVFLSTSHPIEAEKRRSVRVSGPSVPVLRFSMQRSATATHSSAFEPTPAMTIQFSVYLTLERRASFSPLLAYAAQQGPTPSALYQLGLASVEGEGLLVRFGSNVGAKIQIHGTRPLPRRTWTRVTIVVDGTTGSMYFGSDRIPANVFLNDAPEPSFGSSRVFRVGNFFGALSQVRIWNRALSATEIAATVRNPSVPADRLAVHWPLDDGTGRVARDLGPNGATLVLPPVTFEGDPAPRWIRSDVLEQGPLFELVRYFPNSPPVSWTGRQAVALDITGDGLADLVDLRSIPGEQLVCGYPYVSGSAPRGYAYRNLGGGAFAEDSTLLEGPPSTPFRVFVADVTGDGRKDVVDIETGPEWGDGSCGTTHPNWPNWWAPGGQSRILVTQAAGGLRDETATRMPARLSFDHGGTVGDLDGDGDQDILAVSSAGPYTCTAASLTPGAKCSVIFINDGNGVFTEDYARLPMAVSTRELGIHNSATAFDADRDGDLDIVMGLGNGPPGNANLFLLNDGSGRFSVAPEGAMPIEPNMSRTSGMSWVEPGDFDRDGWTDLFTGGDGGMTLYLNNRNGTFRVSPNAFSSTEGRGAYVARAIDMNADGALDLVLQELPYDRVIFNRGDGTFIEPPPLDDFDLGATLLPVDADGDGDLDLMGTDCCTPGFFVMYQRRRFEVK